MAKEKKVFTTGEVAKICSVATRTVHKWFDNGILGGYRIPCSKDRRIPAKELIRFMKEYKIPMPEEWEEVMKNGECQILNNVQQKEEAKSEKGKKRTPKSRR